MLQKIKREIIIKNQIWYTDQKMETILKNYTFNE